MSRSYRKPYATEGYGSPDKKRRKRKAARAVRQAKQVSSGGEYRKHSNPWGICDYKIYSPDTRKQRSK